MRTEPTQLAPLLVHNDVRTEHETALGMLAEEREPTIQERGVSEVVLVQKTDELGPRAAHQARPVLRCTEPRAIPTVAEARIAEIRMEHGFRVAAIVREAHAPVERLRHDGVERLGQEAAVTEGRDADRNSRCAVSTRQIFRRQ